MSKSLHNHIGLLSHTRLRELMMQESLENMVEFSLAMSQACAPDCLRILSISAPDEATDGAANTGRPRKRAPTQATIIPYPMHRRCG